MRSLNNQGREWHQSETSAGRGFGREVICDDGFIVGALLHTRVIDCP